jgi:hypothetical protein
VSARTTSRPGSKPPTLPARLPDCPKCRGAGSLPVYATQGDVLASCAGIPAARPNPRSLVVLRKWERSHAAHPMATGWQSIGCTDCLGTGHKLRVRDSLLIGIVYPYVVIFKPWFRRFRQFRGFSDTSR